MLASSKNWTSSCPSYKSNSKYSYQSFWVLWEPLLECDEHWPFFKIELEPNSRMLSCFLIVSSSLSK